MALGREMSTPPKLQLEYGTLYLYLYFSWMAFVRLNKRYANFGFLNLIPAVFRYAASCR